MGRSCDQGSLPLDWKLHTAVLAWSAGLALSAASVGAEPPSPADPPPQAAPSEPSDDKAEAPTTRRRRGSDASPAESTPQDESPTQRRRRGSAAETEAPADAPPAVVVPELTEDEVRDAMSEFEKTGGFAGESPWGPVNYLPRSMIALPDRWRIGWPAWDRYGRQAPNDDILMNASGGDSPYTLGNPLNPYDRNVLKGDYPIAGDDIFLTATAVSDTFYQWRRQPTPSGVSAADPGSFGIFGDGEQRFLNQTVLLSLDLFKGYTAFRPVDWLLRFSGGWNINYLEVEEFNVTNIDPRRGDEREDQHFFVQEAFYEYHLGDTSERFDIAALRAGRQLFVSDFRGFIFNDVSDGVRVLGNFGGNRVQCNLAFFNQNEKDTNSGLNELNWREQQVVIANLFVQDFIWPGYTAQVSYHFNNDDSDTRFNKNGAQVRPDLVGTATPHSIDAHYLGWAGDGHIGRLNLSHAAYYAFGNDSLNPLAGTQQDISAYMAAIELSVDIDWLRPKASFLYASGDRDPTNGTATGFDGILDNPTFAGGPSSFYQQSGLGILGVNLTNPRSFYNDLSASNNEGQANFVNPGTILGGLGFDAELTPKLRTSFNLNSIWFARTDALELFLNQNSVSPHVGYEANVVFQYRPILNNNIIVTAGASLFFPGDGFEDIYNSDRTLHQVFVGLTLTY